MINQCQHTLGGIGFQEVFQATKNSKFWRTVGILAPGVVAFAADKIANYLDPTRPSWSSLHTVIGSITSFGGMFISSYLTGKHDLDN